MLNYNCDQDIKILTVSKNQWNLLLSSAETRYAYEVVWY